MGLLLTAGEVGYLKVKGTRYERAALFLIPLFSLFSLLILVLMYYLFLPQLILNPSSIAYQQIDLKRFTLFESMPLEDLDQICLGKFKGFGRYDSVAKSKGLMPELTYHWTLHGVRKRREVLILLDFDHIQELIVFNRE